MCPLCGEDLIVNESGDLECPCCGFLDDMDDCYLFDIDDYEDEGDY